ncbi:Protein NRT1/ PTR FAMILY 5.5 [Striga hermonthica]|uniref:Protein NRT1/ PTR FAMILY 5.5 n=1 Tax=Striga hermonthica TaxID=68872 RepID=A0A9N7RLV5_STRHE|nr:Protein NRT1/ PTR FAMILY 5.5 [Striga hermonthica]
MPLIAFGMAEHLTSLTSFINEQFSGEELDGSTFWRFFYSVLAIIIVTSVAAGSCSYKYFKPPGSSFTLFFQVFVAAFLEISHKSPRDAKELFEFTNPEFYKAPHTRSLRNRYNNKAQVVTVARVVVLMWLDIFAIYAMYIMMTYLTDVWDLGFTHAVAIVNVFWGCRLVIPAAPDCS